MSGRPPYRTPVLASNAGGHPGADPELDRLYADDIEADRRLHITVTEPPIHASANAERPAAPEPHEGTGERHQDRATAPNAPGAVANFNDRLDHEDRFTIQHHLDRAYEHLQAAAEIALASTAVTLAPEAQAASIRAAAGRVMAIVRHAREDEL
jgi:hypothetical protein